MVNREKTLVALAKALCNNIAGAGSTNFFHAKGAKIYFTQRAQSFFNTQRTQRVLITQRAQSTREGEAREGQQRKARSSAESTKDGGCTYNICKRLNTGQNT